MDPSQLQPGYRLDRYELLCPLAYGGMASVWLARFGGRLGFERLVVIKMILPQYSQDPRFKEMFLDEARIASRIEHSNVARILDVGEHEDNYFIVMEWVDGDSLAKLLRAAEAQGTRVPLGVSARICADAAAGLHAAHTLADREGRPLGVVHRDVSPQNLLVANSGATMLIDFGVAKARDRISQETSAGELKGKIRYMAPEQARGLPIDLRADVWALGAILYELLSGAAPFEGANEVATLHKLTSGVPAAPLPADVPGPLRAVAERALSADPNLRHASALEMNLELERAMMAIGAATSTAIVARYAGEVLGDRKAARKSSVDAALARTERMQAAAGAAARDTPPATATGPLRLQAPGESQGRPLPERTAAMPHAPVAPMMAGPQGSAPRPFGMPDTMSLGESPSGASSATLGSAAMEYPGPADDAAARQRRNVGMLLAVSAAVASLGLWLIVGTALRSREKAASAPPTETAAPLPPTRAFEPPDPPATATPSATSASSAPLEPGEAASATTRPTAASTASATAASTSATTAARTAPMAAARDSHAGPAPSPARSTAIPTTTSTTAKTPKTATTAKRDYGF